MKVFWTYPDWGSEEQEAVNRVAKSGWVTMGRETQKFEEELAEYIGCRYVTVVDSGTSALIVALFAHGLGKSHSVAVPTYTFIAPANAARLVGANVVLTDCNLDTFNMNFNRLDFSKLRAIIAVDTCGMPNDINKLRKICEENDVILIEDAAEAFGAKYKNRKIGSFGHTTIFSFHIAKQITTIEGGCIATNDSEIDRRCKIIRNQGMEEKARGEYNHELLGFNFRITDIRSAVGRAQLKKVDKYLQRRNEIASLYKKKLSKHFRFQEMPSYITLHPYMIFQLVTPTDTSRNKITAKFNNEKIDYRICWKPVHMQGAWKNEVNKGDYSSSEWLHRHTISLPIGNIMPLEHAEHVCEKILETVKK